MTRINLEQQDEIIERLSKAEAILECFSLAIDPCAAVKVSEKSIQNTVWVLSELIIEANKIAGGNHHG